LKTPEDIHAWIASNFSYDPRRTMRLSETQVAQQEPPAIFTPSQFFSIKAGKCVDLSRFAVETMKIISPQYDAKYLMIEVDPLSINGNVLRWHWLVSFKRDGRTFFFADSNRPGRIVGPFKGTVSWFKLFSLGSTEVGQRWGEAKNRHEAHRPAN
jgi:hypothetical protein